MMYPNFIRISYKRNHHDNENFIKHSTIKLEDFSYDFTHFKS